MKLTKKNIRLIQEKLNEVAKTRLIEEMLNEGNWEVDDYLESTEQRLYALCANYADGCLENGELKELEEMLGGLSNFVKGETK